ncbi:hypothetical protein R1sor_024484 [Riccia sorocarpa]|uniref:Uncharacterized protein n=1 Tax=Riccia sorocarpa TaxID=122646 RepID=A0ABD3GQQ2_9MARC
MGESRDLRYSQEDSHQLFADDVVWQLTGHEVDPAFKSLENWAKAAKVLFLEDLGQLGGGFDPGITAQCGVDTQHRCWSERNNLMFNHVQSILPSSRILMTSEDNCQTVWRKLNGDQGDRLKRRDEGFLSKAKELLERPARIQAILQEAAGESNPSSNSMEATSSSDSESSTSPSSDREEQTERSDNSDDTNSL